MISLLLFGNKSNRSMASSSSSSQTISSSSFKNWIYEVFLSFRGEDTRKTFVDHLYTALEQQGIYTYKDDETLQRGESIAPSLLKAIKESQIAIVVFSKNYADSSWCLDELAHVMECRKDTGQIVMPIFYDVEPSEVRKLEGKFGEGFSKHQSKDKNKVEIWRKSLVDACNIAGWETKQIANGHESKCIKEIVEKISHMLDDVLSSSIEDLVGIETRVKELKSKLEIGLAGVLMVGIWGVGGGGKTTLASCVYHEISSMFDGCCSFVENVREKSSKYGLEKLQEDLLSDILKNKQREVGGIKKGRHLLKRRLFHRKVLIVLDDVDDHEQLEALAGSHDWFGEGSRIIITTRDKHLLNAHRVNVIHNIRLLNNDEGIKLFRKHAPQIKGPIEEYELLLKELVSYACGLPLALKVLGCFLCDKDINEWRSALERLEEIPDSDIVKKLKISYDGLPSIEKELFLDIACFFRGESKHKAMEILDGCGFFPLIGIKVLIQKALITISEDGEFDMHDMIQEMGHYIVRGEHPYNPEKHSRVWKVEDVRKLCTIDATTELDKIEAIKVYSPMNDPLPRNHHFVANMKKLRWIELTGERHSKSLLPKNFPSRELCCLILESRLQRHLWEGYKNLPYLRMIKLRNLKKLIETPDFGGLPNLKRIELTRCPKLEKIHPSIEGLERLVHIKVCICKNLKIFPTITRSQKLEIFEIIWCEKLFKDSKIDKNMNSVEKVENLDKKKKEVADTEDDDVNTNIECCLSEESSLPRNIFNLIGLHIFQRAVRVLTLRYCNMGDGDIDSLVWDLCNLKELNLSNNNFSRLDFSILKLPRLKWLDVSWCERLNELSGLPSSIATLKADKCRSLESVGDISKCKWLWNISLLGENKLGPHGDDILPEMLQGNAIEHHFINFRTDSIHDIPKGLVDRLVRVKTFSLKLPDNWYNHFSGFLICTAATSKTAFPRFTISITEEVDIEDSDQCGVCHDSINEEPSRPYIYSTTCVGYLSFDSLMRDITWLNKAFNTISISEEFKEEKWLVAELVSRENNDDHVVQTTKVPTDFSAEFYDRGNEYGRKIFKIKHRSTTSINILWNPISD